MLIADVNVLVHGFMSDAPDHLRYASWLQSAIDGDESFGLVDATVIGFIRVVTNPRIYRTPASTASATAFVDALAGADTSRWLAPTQSTWERFRQIVATDRHLAGTLVPDAWLAAITISHGGRLATADRGFGRFDGLEWFDPGR